MDQIKDIKRIWDANEEFWNNKIVANILAPLESKGGLDTAGLWQHVLATAFGRSQRTFEAIQLLCNPNLPRRLWDDAFVLTRSHYETFITLEWIAIDSEPRAQLFFDEYSLKMAHLIDLLGNDGKDINPKDRIEIYKERDEALKRHKRGPGTLGLLPSLEERVKALAEPLKHAHPNLVWEYDFYYRDVSGFAHPSGWGTALSLSSKGDDVPMVESSPRIGYNAVNLNGAWLFRILQCWNREFRILASGTIDDWQREWAQRSGHIEES